MTTRATFGDFADAVTWHLTQLTGPGSAASPAPGPGVHAEDIPGGVRAAVHVMARYSEDIWAVFGAIPDADRPGHAPWIRAASRTREALHDADTLLRQAPPARSPSRRNPPAAPAAGPLHAAATSMELSRDLLHTHFSSRRDGTRHGRSEWAPVIASIPVARALLHEVAGWARQIAPHGTHAAITGPYGIPASRRGLTAACQWLSVLSWAIEAAHEQQPVPASELRLLRDIPVNTLTPRHLPSGGEPVSALCQGVISTGERARAAARASAAQASWSPAFTRESLRQTADYCTVVSWNCHLLLRTLADHADQQGPARLSATLENAARAADSARAAWLHAAQSWDTITTDTRGRISPATAEAADLALWTGRLAYADPAWTPAAGPCHDTRPPQELLAQSGDLRHVVTAAHYSCHTMTRLAASAIHQMRTAAGTGRLIVPTRSLPGAFDIPYRYAPAPPWRAEPLLDAYREAAAASEHAEAALDNTAAAVKAPSQVLAAIRAVAQPPASGRRTHEHHAAGPPALPHPQPAMPGPAQRTLLDLNVTDPADLRLAAALDHAVNQLILRAARTPEATADAMTPDLNQSSGAAELISHLLATSGHQAPAARHLPAAGGTPARTRTGQPAESCVKTELPASLTAPRQARAAIRQALTDWHLTELSPDAELLASEVVANAAEHAGTDPIGLTLREYTAPSGRTGVTCEVTDSSPAPPGYRPAAPDSERGRGLAILAATAWANGITLHPDRKTISFTLTTPSEPDQATWHPDIEPEAET